VQSADLKETTRREWLHAEDLIFRFEGSNCLCDFGNFLAKTLKNRSCLILDQRSRSTEKRTLKRGELPALLKLATTFLERLLLRAPPSRIWAACLSLQARPGFLLILVARLCYVQ
jgi:hypothetical protein